MRPSADVREELSRGIIVQQSPVRKEHEPEDQQAHNQGCKHAS
eukprot:CAMPEP_0202404670 /NCGR_PEP_ID=MMETSP1128-20130828/5845_1 /ASSEMBLY_ACC=CAM_ASM_000463 /TAXON_ID=3047 /ORGANISM="Dunaliella tertiolecta, Strain CCMP1320" /LENGTH=42 /DNA_ID= /DNA_START= /DNA_END= /DNA_ORIENTATION=